MARAQKENQKNPQRVGPPNPHSAADRTLTLYKHRCIHCGALDPCVPETLVAVASGDAQNGAPGTGAFTATEGGSVDVHDTHPGVDAIPHDDAELASVSEPEDWRNGIQETTTPES